MSPSPLPRYEILAFLGVAILGCSGSGGHKDAAGSDARVDHDGAAGRLDDRSPIDQAPSIDGGPAGTDLARRSDAPPATNDLSADLAPEAPSRLDGSDVAGRTQDAPIDGAGGAKDSGSDFAGASRDVGIASPDAAQPPPEVASPRDSGTDIRADAPSGTTADAPSAGRDAGPDISSGNAIVERLAAAAALCGPQSPRTVPVGWQMVMVGDKGCTFYAPPSWLVIGAGTPNTFAVEDETRVTGSAVMAGVDTTGTATCTPHGVATWLFANNKDCVGFRELYWKDSVDVIAGIQIPRGDMVYACTQSGVPIAGYLVVQIHGTWPMCNLLTFAFWMPETQIETRTCTLTQTLNSIQCPQGGGSCDDSTCAQSCDSGMGACDDNGACVCY